MSSFLRDIQRKAAKKGGHYKNKGQFYREHGPDDDGYDYCHRTRGWKRVSAAQLAAQVKMAYLLGGRT